MRVACLAIGLIVAGAASAQNVTLTVRVSDVESNEGQVYVGLCDRGLAESECLGGRFQPARRGEMTFVFENIPAGVYAVAAYHDVNGNGVLDTNFLGIPREPYGFSNDAGRRGPPNFNSAQVPVNPPRATINVRLDRFRFGG
ncbi:MAG: DUF2141 domain-containing protein [Salinarimonadaceae bacterium]|nr:MAG: DUF2141 domain-containing protein [Salinarimonadaceae bacterium]